jgi:beta-ureidopropionase / N-carbamoyl-L-amino-acid hydrolase
VITLPPDPTAYSRALATLWNEIATIGRNPATGGYRRFAWTDEDRTLREWFAGAATDRGLDVTMDRAGNQWAWWGDPDAAAIAGRPGLVVGSHLDSVPDGGPYDGPLGVVSSLAAIEVLRSEGFRPERPVGVVNFGDEEGARYGVACAGSRILTGALDADRARALRDVDGRTMAEGMAAAGLDPLQIGPDPVALQRIGTFVELHVEQGRGLVDLGAPVGVASSIWPHGRWRFDFDGEANHAGTTRLADRRDPMIGYAGAVLAARRAAEEHGALATFGKVLVEPNGVNAIPSRVSAWLDARGPSGAAVRGLVRDLSGVGALGADGASVREESWTDETTFDTRLRSRLSALLAGPDGTEAPILATGAGHDAGILSLALVETAMLFVRNPTGVSHSPEEFAEEADCISGVTALARVVRELAS